MNQKAILVRTIEVIIFLFGAFGHFLTRIAPPDSTGLSFAVGFTSLVSLAILLIISLISTKFPAKKKHKVWLATGIILLFAGFITAFIYWQNFQKLTFSYPIDQPQGRYLAGLQLTADAQHYLQQNPNATSAAIVADFGGLPMKTKVWSKESIDKSETRLTVIYVFLVLSLASAIFCLLEGLVVQKN